MKNILIPYDFSDTAINALNYTKKLFEGQKMNIFLLDVYIGQKSHLLSQERSHNWFKEMDNEIEDELYYLVEVLNKEEKGFVYNFIVDTNSLTKAVKEAIKEENIDLVISGTKGLTETFVGTNTVKIINAIETTPIIVVPTNYKYKKISNILFSTNYKRTFYKKEIDTLIEINNLKNSLIEIINISEKDSLSEKQKNNKLKLEELLKGTKADFLNLPWSISERSTINKYIKETNDDLLVLINHKYNFFNKLLEENLIKEISFNSSIPLLILPDIE